MQPAVLTVNGKGAGRVAAGHPWVYANEIREPVKSFAPASLVDVRDPRGRTLGFGFVNPRSLICARILSRETSTFDAAFFAAKLKAANALRARFRPGEKSYRLCFGESDGLPGLVIDRFEDVYVVQSHAAGIDALVAPIVEGLVREFAPRGVLLKFDSSARQLEGLEKRLEVAHGEVPEELEVAMEGSRFVLDLRRGQKTGFFHDQAPNRAFLAAHAKGTRVLDVFSYVGAWALAAAKGGAREVLGVDVSADAVAWAERNAKASGVSDRVKFEKADAFAKLETLEKSRARWDVVVLDPPAFVKSKKSLDAGLKGYREINRRGFALVEDGGLLVAGSCSRHVTREAFLGVLLAAANDAKRGARIVHIGSQGPDHPIHLRLPETEYLKCVFLEVGPLA
ncbi:MAG TPA: class I SAM-dependent rRNA methyltransferase [bacterium]|nr:class I SAM-dependent rRNA methyltransferase [bacterium]